jgi:regulator of RNase E activity RraA
MTDKELFATAKKELFTALVGDVLDKLGCTHQFLPQYMKPLSVEMVLIGRAMPVLEADVFEEKSSQSHNPMMKKPFGLMFEALDDLQEDEVYVCAGSSHNYALWGGLMSTRAVKLKSAGAVVDGFLRDTNEILSLQFPCFSAGAYAQDQGVRGKVIDYRVPIEFGGIPVHPGDIVFGDRDGIVIVPQSVEQEVFEKALEKARGEKLVKKALQEGMTTVDAFAQYGIM